MARIGELTQEEEEALRLGVAGKDIKEIAQVLEVSYKTQRERFLRIYEKLGTRNLHGATALYANLMGLRGELIKRPAEFEQEFEAENIPVLKGTSFGIGKLRYPAAIVSSAFRSPNEVKCIVSEGQYDALPEFSGRLDQLREIAVRQAIERGEIAYERPGGGLLLVNRLEAGTEFYRPLRLRLLQAGYFTVRAIRENLTPELKTKYAVDPFHVVNAALPLPLSVCLHIIAGDPPHLIICKRSANLGTYSGFYSGAVQALGEADNDVAIIEGEKIFDPLAAMVRELGEERTLLAQGLPLARLREAIKMLDLVFDYRVLTYILTGYIWLPKANPEAITKSMSEAKEGTYEMLPFPDPKSSSFTRYQTLRSLCEHLINQPWCACCGIGIISLLERTGVRHGVLYPLLGQPLQAPS
jgi:DNA-binding CsgD family transcriptional regulator